MSPAPTPAAVNLGALLRDGRTAAGISREEAAKLIGIGDAVLSQMENGEASLMLLTEFRVYALIDLYKLSPRGRGSSARRLQRIYG